MPIKLSIRGHERMKPNRCEYYNGTYLGSSCEENGNKVTIQEDGLNLEFSAKKVYTTACRENNNVPVVQDVFVTKHCVIVFLESWFRRNDSGTYTIECFPGILSPTEYHPFLLGKNHIWELIQDEIKSNSIKLYEANQKDGFSIESWKFDKVPEELERIDGTSIIYNEFIE